MPALATETPPRMSSYSFAPPGETAAELWVERSNFDGNLITGVGYGVLLTLTAQTLALFLRRPRHRVPWGLVLYVAALFLLATLGLAGNAAFTQSVFVDNRAFPGGPNAWTAAHYSAGVNMMAFAAYIVMNWMASALVLWRFTMFWGTNLSLSVVPLLVFLGSVGSSLLFLLATARPTPALAPLAVPAGIAYWALSLGLNVVLALAIAARILLVRRALRRLLRATPRGPALADGGTGGLANGYVGIAAMLVESAALYAVWGVLFLICFARNTPLQNVLVGMLGQVQGIAPLLIVFRVAQGRAWAADTALATGRSRSRATPIGPFTVGSGGSGGFSVYGDGASGAWDDGSERDGSGGEDGRGRSGDGGDGRGDGRASVERRGGSFRGGTADAGGMEMEMEVKVEMRRGSLVSVTVPPSAWAP
ncbi:hypothetical protein B0H15DRAFT_952701 [Mycena belliarum]|uniref:Uncharacterized protein n=1 Tax=Mycena belliarum TaxID=1033014 RepID=A0AAD6XIY7_9AGAR|nr:hypothetical protein B0H15DRAFT_952701 [Mycena belliae]